MGDRCLNTGPRALVIAVPEHFDCGSVSYFEIFLIFCHPDFQIRILKKKLRLVFSMFYPLSFNEDVTECIDHVGWYVHFSMNSFCEPLLLSLFLVSMFARLICTHAYCLWPLLDLFLNVFLFLILLYIKLLYFRKKLLSLKKFVGVILI